MTKKTITTARERERIEKEKNKTKSKPNKKEVASDAESSSN